MKVLLYDLLLKTQLVFGELGQDIFTILKVNKRTQQGRPRKLDFGKSLQSMCAYDCIFIKKYARMNLVKRKPYVYAFLLRQLINLYTHTLSLLSYLQKAIHIPCAVLILKTPSVICCENCIIIFSN